MTEESEQIFFNYGSILPLIIFIIGILEIYFFVSGLYSEGFFTMMVAFVVYLLAYFIEKNEDFNLSQFNRLLENHATFMAFGLSSIVFGVTFYKGEENFLLLIIVYFFALATILSTARNWVMIKTHRNGWPLPLNGLFLPFVYYIYDYYLHDIGGSIFLVYFILIGFLATTNYNFIDIKSNNKNDDNENL